MARRSCFILSTARTLSIVFSLGFALFSLKKSNQTSRALHSFGIEQDNEVNKPTQIRFEPTSSNNNNNTYTSAKSVRASTRSSTDPGVLNDFSVSSRSGGSGSNLDQQQQGGSIGKLLSAIPPLPHKNDELLPKQDNEKDKNKINDLDSNEKKCNTSNVHVVVSHCNKPVGWIWEEYFRDITNQTSSYNIKSITFISKCNIPIPVDDLPYHYYYSTKDVDRTPQFKPKTPKPIPLVTVVSLPNVGRCDHSYAFWITKVLMGGNYEEQTAKNHSNTTDNLTRHNRDSYREYRLLYSNHHNSYKYNLDLSNNDGDGDGDGHDDENDDDPFQKISRFIDPADLVLFMKDNNNAYRAGYEDQTTLLDMFDAISRKNATANSTESSFNSKGVACASFYAGNDQRYRQTKWAHRSVLWTFHLRRYEREYYTNTTDHYSNNSKSAVNNEPDNILHVNNFRSDHRPMGNWIKHLFNRSSSLSSHSPSPLVEQQQQQRHQQQQQQQKQLPVFSNKYLENAIHGVNELHGYYYNVTQKNNGTDLSNTSDYYKLDIVPVCYGGVFSTQWGQLSSQDAPVTKYGWRVVTDALGRGDSIEEGHYMERWWGDILSWSSYSSRLASNGTSSLRDRDLDRSDGGVGVLTATEQKALLENKLMHRKLHSPYVGIIVLNGKKLLRQEIISNWKAIRRIQKQLRLDKESSIRNAKKIRRQEARE